MDPSHTSFNSLGIQFLRVRGRCSFHIKPVQSNPWWIIARQRKKQLLQWILMNSRYLKCLQDPRVISDVLFFFTLTDFRGNEIFRIWCDPRRLVLIIVFERRIKNTPPRRERSRSRHRRPVGSHLLRFLHRQDSRHNARTSVDAATLLLE